MGHNVDKCKTLHLGNHNPGHQYTMNGNPRVKTSAEKDLGVTVDEHLKFHVHTGSREQEFCKLGRVHLASTLQDIVPTSL